MTVHPPHGKPHPLFDDVGDVFFAIRVRAELAEGCCAIGDAHGLEHFARAPAEDLRRAIPLVKALRPSDSSEERAA
jgi:hypothetical protein